MPKILCCTQTSPICVLIDAELLAMEFSHCGDADLRWHAGFRCENTGWLSTFFAPSCDLDLDPMTFIYELDPYSLEIRRMCKYELSTSML